MTMAPGVRKFALTTHVTTSVGWLGAVATSLVLAAAALISQDTQTVRATYLAMELIGWYALVPLSFASLITGLVQSLGTTWGLLRHYWVLIKLLMNLFATAVLLLYMQTLGFLGDLAAQSAPSEAGLGVLRGPSALLHASGAMLLLLVAATLSVYKPRGMTKYGQRRLRAHTGIAPT